MQLETALATTEGSAVPISLESVPAPATGLAGVPGIDEDHGLTEFFRLVSGEELELCIAPSSQFFVETLSFAFFLLDIELFKGNGIKRQGNQLIADAVVEVSHKPSFSTRKFFEFALCRASANGLKLIPQELESAFMVFQIIGIKEHVVGTNSNVIHTKVNSQHCTGDFRFGSFLLGDENEEQSSVLVLEGGGLDWPAFVSVKISRDFDGDFLPPRDSAHGNVTAFKAGLESAEVVSNTAQLPFLWLNFELAATERFAGNVPRSLNQAALELRELLPDGVVDKPIELVFVVGFDFPTHVDKLLTSHVKQFYCLEEVYVIATTSSYCTPHENRLYNKHLNVSWLQVAEDNGGGWDS